jgi:hypothetical protein
MLRYTNDVTETPHDEKVEGSRSKLDRVLLGNGTRGIFLNRTGQGSSRRLTKLLVDLGVCVPKSTHSFVSLLQLPCHLAVIQNFPSASRQDAEFELRRQISSSLLSN